MSKTRGNILDRVAGILGDSSTTFRTYLEGSLNDALEQLYTAHDWNFKHKLSSFNTAASTETYALMTTITDLRSANDIEFMYDSTKGRKIYKKELREIKLNYPQADATGDPEAYAPWGASNIYVHPIPTAVNIVKVLYIAKPTFPTSDVNDMWSTCGLPEYMHGLLEKMVLAEGMLYVDEDRHMRMIEYVERVLLPRYVKADMKHLENDARMKFWEEEYQASGLSYDDFLRREVFNEEY